LYVWLGAALLMLLCPGPSCVIPLILIATFVSFALLDERG
jgi:hypothetical protein